jgi:hypothetical protein
LALSLLPWHEDGTRSPSQSIKGPFHRRLSTPSSAIFNNNASVVVPPQQDATLVSWYSKGSYLLVSWALCSLSGGVASSSGGNEDIFDIVGQDNRWHVFSWALFT